MVRGLVSGYQEAAAECWDSHSLEHSGAERVVLPQITELTGFMLTEVYAIATGAWVDGGAVARAVKYAPGDSYRIRNAKVATGKTPDEAYDEARAQSIQSFDEHYAPELASGPPPDVGVAKLYGPS